MNQTTPFEQIEYILISTMDCWDFFFLENFCDKSRLFFLGGGCGGGRGDVFFAIFIINYELKFSKKKSKQF